MANFELLLLAATGLLLGLAHSLDPDHVIAISALLCNSTGLRKSIISATAWGARHSVTVLLVGLFVVALKVVVLGGVANLLELPGGVMLIILGLFLVKSVVTNKAHASHTHPLQEADMNERSFVGAHSHLRKSMVTGVLQGLGGSVALVLVMLTTVPSTVLCLFLLLVFGAGVILGMVGIMLNRFISDFNSFEPRENICKNQGNHGHDKYWFRHIHNTAGLALG